MLSNLHKDIVTIIKGNGDKIENVKANVQKNQTFISGSDLLIEPGDIIQRKMTNGGMETYKVIDPGFKEGSGYGIPAHYQIAHKNLSIPEAENAIQQITYNISGNNARVNNHSVDNSTNTVIVNQAVLDQLQALRDEINRLVTSPQEKIDANEVVDAVEEQLNSEKPKKAVVSTLLASLPQVGNVASIGSFLLSCFGG